MGISPITTKRAKRAETEKGLEERLLERQPEPFWTHLGEMMMVWHGSDEVGASSNPQSKRQ